MARTIPEGAERGPRDKQVAIYLSKEEIILLEKVAENLGFRSKTALIVYALEDVIKGGFSQLSFMRTGKTFGKLIEESGNGHIDWDYVNPFKEKKKKKQPPSKYEEK